MYCQSPITPDLAEYVPEYLYVEFAAQLALPPVFQLLISPVSKSPLPIYSISAGGSVLSDAVMFPQNVAQLIRVLNVNV